MKQRQPSVRIIPTRAMAHPLVQLDVVHRDVRNYILDVRNYIHDVEVMEGDGLLAVLPSPPALYSAMRSHKIGM